MIGANLGHFQIVARLGAGGMGEVYRARDTRLGRDVAIKVLPAKSAADPERLRRFEQEARATAALDHPNILAIHDIGSHEGRPYLVVELLEGESLRARLQGGALPPRKVIEAAVQVCSGLAAAHEKGIVHRDLKPENVFVTRDGVVKILDFGLARLQEPDAGDQTPRESAALTETRPGTVLGTAAYMSPEQVRGQGLDHRSDIFSLGVTLYEMLSGQQPFARDTVADTVSAILSRDPPPLPAREGEMPAALPGIVSQCLEKRPEDRFSSAHDLALALRLLSGRAEASPPQKAVVMPARRLSSRLVIAGVAAVALVAVVMVGWLLSRGPAAPSNVAQERPARIVVLPFENLGSPEDAYFAAGMAEEITSRLANVKGLGVISRTSAFAYDRKGKTVKQIGGDLGVDYVLEDSVRWEHGAGRESRVRITPQLIRVADDTHVWSDRYERVLADVFALQSEVAESTVGAMGVTLLPRERTALAEVSTTDLAAYDLYLRGKDLDSRGSARKDIEGAVGLYQAAVDRDPRFAQAQAGLAGGHLLMSWEYYDRSPERLARAKHAAERAVELRPDLAESHCALGSYYYRGTRDYPRALAEFAAALKIQPSSAEALSGMGWVLRRQGRWREALDRCKAAADLDPKSAARAFDVGFTSGLAGRYADADRALARALSLNPQWAEVNSERSWLQLLWHGDGNRAQAILDEASQVAGLTDDAGYLAEVQFWVALTRRDYQGELGRLEAETRGAIDSQNAYLPVPLLRGQVHRLAGQHDLARRSFEVARAELEQRIKRDPDDHRLHSSLGIAYAGLGLPDDAVREARLGCELMPASKDALLAILRVEDLAVVYAMVGRSTEAITALDDLLARSGWYTAHVLRLDPRWDALRGDPRLQALLRKYEVKS